METNMKMVERTVIGICLNDRKNEKGLISELMVEMKSEHFTDPASIRIFNYIEDNFAKGKPIAITRMLSEIEIPESYFDLGFLQVEEFDGLLDKLKDEYARRQLNTASSQLARLAAENMSADQYRSKAIETVFACTDNTYGSKEIYSFSQALGLVQADLTKTAEGEPQGIKTGFYSFDKTFGRLSPGYLVLLGGQTSMGKSALALNISYNAIASGKRVMYLSLEMTAKDISQRLLSRQGKIKGSVFHSDKVSEATLKKVEESIDQIGDYPLYISDKRGLTVAEIKAQAIRAKSRYGLDMLVIDYLQNIDHVERGNIAISVGETVKALRDFAGDLEIPILLLSQVNRQVDGRPEMSHLRNSGVSEESADIVMFIYRSDYKEETRLQHSREVQEAELIIAKGRTRGVGYIPLYWYPNYQLFRDKHEVDAEEKYRQSIS
ncbi:DnaB-like helicase C-terminal domain-containing protein [Halanaerobiaceae bacterium Z-7014]|uniref:DnaB-like helicase C-terminal domain-containing protein n=1 Tax=Halonatronomonas betaini TaxID=2778430 RepID=A0A931ATI2_9FIRM|nr:DnaB-like helicase C-terminal domain-containing protein [Halonatronomonas betaini]MBF8436515.1 DnaB-like helicase C-terminal domain-containing protein [Halonatronomonas betaini]